MPDLTSSQEGSLAELKIALQAIELGMDATRPMSERSSCDLIFGAGDGESDMLGPIRHHGRPRDPLRAHLHRTCGRRAVSFGVGEGELTHICG